MSVPYICAREGRECRRREGEQKAVSRVGEGGEEGRSTGRKGDEKVGGEGRGLEP